jgi:hypothetical protein
MKNVPWRSLVWLVCAGLVATPGCKRKVEGSVEDFKNIAPGKNFSKYAYKYMGPMPTFRNITMTVSYDGRTLRVEGEPEGLSEQDLVELTKPAHDLDYVYPAAKRGRWYIVYPIAVPRQSADFEGNTTWNFARIYPRRPWQNGGNGYESHSWELMPWLGYASGKQPGSVAFHTPVTKVDGTGGVEFLHLERGAVSLGCKRMAPEHIIELSHILGLDLHKQTNVMYQGASPELAAVNARGLGSKFIKSIEGVDKVLLSDGSSADVDVDYPFTGVTPKFGPALLVHRTWNLFDQRRNKNICYYEFANYTSSAGARCTYFSDDEVASPEDSAGKFHEKGPGLYRDGIAVTMTPRSMDPGSDQRDGTDEGSLASLAPVASQGPGSSALSPEEMEKFNQADGDRL